MLLNCRENAWESFGLQGNQINQSLNEINPEHSLGGLMLNLKLQFFGYLMWRANPLEKTLMLGKIEGTGEGGGRGQNC